MSRSKGAHLRVCGAFERRRAAEVIPTPVGLQADHVAWKTRQTGNRWTENPADDAHATEEREVVISNKRQRSADAAHVQTAGDDLNRNRISRAWGRSCE